jgi:hypothetical protein
MSTSRPLPFRRRPQQPACRSDQVAPPGSKRLPAEAIFNLQSGAARYGRDPLPDRCPGSGGRLAQGRVTWPANDSQTASIDNEIAHLRGLDLDGLRARWRPRPASPSEPRRRSGRGDGPCSCRGRRALLPGPDRRAPAAAASSRDAAGPSFRSGCAYAAAGSPCFIATASETQNYSRFGPIRVRLGTERIALTGSGSSRRPLRRSATAARAESIAMSKAVMVLVLVVRSRACRTACVTRPSISIESSSS